MFRAKQGGEVYDTMRNINAEVFAVLEEAFSNFGIQSIDFKLEYGIIEGHAMVIDEITGGSFRLWPYAKEKPNLKQDNVFSELDSSGRLDKDTYRQGEALDQVMSKFEYIAKITSKFECLH